MRIIILLHKSPKVVSYFCKLHPVMIKRRIGKWQIAYTRLGHESDTDGLSKNPQVVAFTRDTVKYEKILTRAQKWACLSRELWLRHVWKPFHNYSQQVGAATGLCRQIL